MSLNLTATDTIITGCVRYQDLIYIVTLDDSIDRQIEHSHLYTLDGGTLGYAGVQDWSTQSMTICRHPHEQLLAMSPLGHLRLIGSGLDSEELISTPDGSPETRGLLRKVRNIGQRAYAVGMNRQVYRRDGEGLWVCLDQAIRPAPSEVKGFETVDGFAENDLYAAGWDGEIWHYDGVGWHPCASPTNLVLTSLLCAADGQVYLAGQRGLLLKGRQNSWQIIEQEAMRDDIWDLAWFEGQLYVATYRGLYSLVNEQLVPVDFGDERPTSFYHLSAADGVLWSFGAKDIMAFDGSRWQRID